MAPEPVSVGVGLTGCVAAEAPDGLRVAAGEAVACANRFLFNCDAREGTPFGGMETPGFATGLRCATELRGLLTGEVLPCEPRVLCCLAAVWDVARPAVLPARDVGRAEGVATSARDFPFISTGFWSLSPSI